MCLNPIRLPKITGTDTALVPCGKCAECLANKANDLTVRVVREAEYFKDFFFTTLTYDNDHIPMQVTECNVTADFEEVVNRQYIVDDTELRQDFFKNADYTWVTNKSGKVVKRYMPYKYDEEADITAGDEVFGHYKLAYFTLDNEDFKKYLKAARMKYLRTFHEALPKFKYLAVPEYGGASYRPHFHVLWLGLSQEQVNFMVHCWKNGSVADIQRVSYTMEDMTSVAHYVSQYANKGSFDVPYIREGLCKKPRKCFSLNFGIGDEEDLERRISHWKCEDIYGSYDINDLTEFNEETKNSLVEDILKRRYYDLCGFKYPIPQYLKRKMFYINRKDVDLQKISMITKDKDEQQQLYEERNRPRLRRIKKPDGTYMYKVIKPSPYAKVASALQTMVTTALFEHLDRDITQSVEGETKRAFQSFIEVDASNIDAVLSSLNLSQVDKKASVERNFMNKIANSII